jgi:hypothetical protein
LKQGGQPMNLENFISFCRTSRRLGGHIISKQFKRQGSRHKWLSSFTALSFTFFSAFPALPSQVPLTPVGENEVQSVSENAEVKEITLQELCDFKKNMQSIQVQTGEGTQTKEEEKLCLSPKTKEELLDEHAVDEVAVATDLELTVKEVVKDHPMEVMAPSIARFDRNIAALIVGIGKKESDLGKHSPSKAGEDCYNYWGYKGAGERGTAMGYACFSTPEEAVQTIGERLVRLVEKRATSEPHSLVTTWKCGASCKGHSKESVQSWISSVDQYYSKIALR